jgi:hypothetical protein
LGTLLHAHLLSLVSAVAAAIAGIFQWWWRRKGRKRTKIILLLIFGKIKIYSLLQIDGRCQSGATLHQSDAVGCVWHEDIVAGW